MRAIIVATARANSGVAMNLMKLSRNADICCLSLRDHEFDRRRRSLLVGECSNFLGKKLLMKNHLGKLSFG